MLVLRFFIVFLSGSRCGRRVRLGSEHASVNFPQWCNKESPQEPKHLGPQRGKVGNEEEREGDEGEVEEDAAGHDQVSCKLLVLG